MRVNNLSMAILLSIAGLPLAASAATVTANDQTNSFTGLDSSMMISKDGGHSWVAYSSATQNNFPGSVLAMVAQKQELAIISADYDPNRTYRGGETVRFLGYYWTAQWWVDQGISPSTDPVWKKGDKIDYQTYATFQFTPYTGKAATDLQQKEKAKVAAQRKVIGYFPEWGVYEAHNYFTPDKVDYSGLTHLNYGFAVVKDGVVVMHDSEKAPGLMRDLDSRTEAANVAHMVSIGGWTNSEEGVFEAATATDAGIEKLANSMVSYMRQWNFDGVDVDWEYPDSAAEKAQFTKLIQSLRSKLDAQGLKDDKYYQLSAAVTTNHKNIQYINPQVTASLLDSVNVMAYDIHGAFDPLTGHNAPLFANTKDEDPKFNVSAAMNEYVNTWKVPKAKLMMGIPYYGRGWGHVPGTQIIAGLPGLFATGAATVKGAWDDVGKFTGTNPWYVLKQKLASGEYVRYWDSESRVPYLYSASKQEFLTYDDPQSIKEKVDYINQQGFGGTIIWDLSGDTPDHELGNIVKEIKTTPIISTDDVQSFSVGRSAGNQASHAINIELSQAAFQSSGYFLKLEKVLPYANSPKSNAQNYEECYISRGGITNCPLVTYKVNGSGNVVITYPRNNLMVGSVVSLVTNDTEKKVVRKVELNQHALNTATGEDILDMRYVPASGDATAAVIETTIPNTLAYSANMLAYYLNGVSVGTISSSLTCGGISSKNMFNGTTVQSFKTVKDKKYTRTLKAGDVITVYLKDEACTYSKDPKPTNLLRSFTITSAMVN